MSRFASQDAGPSPAFLQGVSMSLINEYRHRAG